MRDFSEADRVRCESCGGMTSSGSFEVMRCQMGEASGSPGTMAGPLSPCLKAPSAVSRRRSPSRALASKPWQAKQRSERRGRMSELKLSGRSSPSAANARRTERAERVRCRSVIMRRCDPTQCDQGNSRKKEGRMSSVIRGAGLRLSMMTILPAGTKTMAMWQTG